MLSKYIQAAMRQARYEILAEDQAFYGEIESCPGVFAHAETLEACREQLAEVLEDWIFLRLHHNQAIPPVNGVELKVREVA